MKELRHLGPVSRKSRKRFGPEKPFVKLRPTNCVKLVFSYVVKGIKITARFRASRRLSFEELCHPKCARKVSGLSRNRPQGFLMAIQIWKGLSFAKINADYVSVIIIIVNIIFIIVNIIFIITIIITIIFIITIIINYLETYFG